MPRFFIPVLAIATVSRTNAARTLVAGLFTSALLASPASADRIKNPTAVFAGLDKITGRIISFEVQVDETVQFGSLQLTPRVCYSRPPYENPQTTSFIEVDEITLNNETKRLFSGWMFAASPGLNAIDHPVYDIWLTDCKGGTEIIKTPPDVADVGAPPAAVEAKPKRTPAAQNAARPTLARQPSQRFYPTNVPPAPSAAPPPPQPRFNEYFDPLRGSDR